MKKANWMEELLHQRPVFTLDTAERYFGRPGERAAIKRLQRLQAKGRVVRALRGVYASVPPGVDPKSFQPDPYLILHALRPDGVFCGHSALDLHGVSNQPWNRVTAYSAAKAVTYKTRYATFALIRRPDWLTADATSTIDRKGVFLNVTCPELTLIEGFRYPGRVGGVEELVKSAESYRRLDLPFLMDLLDRFHMRKLYAAVGWFLARDSARWGVADEFLERLKARRPSSPSYLERGSSGSTLDSEWNLMIPRELSRQEEQDLDF